MKFLLVLFIAVFFSLGAQSQNVVVNEAPEVAQMMRTFISKQKSQDAIRGWRIQIITTDDRRKMERAIAKFQNLYPDIQLKWEHVSPYYKVQIGAYETKLSLQGFLLDLKNDFPSAIPVLDDVLKSELVAY